MPATTCWSSRASPSSRVGSSSRRRRRKTGFVERRRRHDVGSQSGQTLVEPDAGVGQQLEDRPTELHDLVVAAPQDEPCRALRARPAFAAPQHAPGAGHAQVGVDDEPAGEAQQEVLARGVGGDELAAGQPLGPAIAAEARVRRHDLVGHAAGKDGADAQRGVMDGVALRHRRARG